MNEAQALQTLRLILGRALSSFSFLYIVGDTATTVRNFTASEKNARRSRSEAACG